MNKLPAEIISIGQKLAENGYQAYLVGGCVRDLVLDKTPKDWDLTSAATPDKILEIFEHAHYDNDFGTVRIVNDEASDKSLEVVEITTFRQDIGYSDDRRPDQIKYSTELTDDLKRRDFTINALAYPIGHVDSFDLSLVKDFHNGLNDIKDKLIKTVGNPNDRFGEDALRLIRAIRFAAQLNFAIDPETLIAIDKNSAKLANIAVERITDEFNKLVMTDNPLIGLELLRRTNLLNIFIPELLEGVGINQNQAHSYTVWEHLLRTLQAASDKSLPLDMRLSALFHDIGKPASREVSHETAEPTFYNHEMIGARMTEVILKRLKYPKRMVTRVTLMVRWHMFFSDPDEVTLSAVRRLIANVGQENIWDLVDLRVCDRIGTGRPKEEPYRLRKFKAMIEEASRQPTSVKQLSIDGNNLINEFHMKPGPKIGQILHILLQEVLDEPTLNNQEYLSKRATELNNFADNELAEKAAQAKEEIHAVEAGEIKAIRDKYFVK